MEWMLSFVEFMFRTVIAVAIAKTYEWYWYRHLHIVNYWWCMIVFRVKDHEVADYLQKIDHYYHPWKHSIRINILVSLGVWFFLKKRY